MNTKRIPLAERFWPKVVKSNGCWAWQGAVDRAGYGWVGLGGKHGGSRRAHRVAWELTSGPIPPGMLVCHHCDNPRCVRPDHLFLGTNADNHRDRDAKGRQAIGEDKGTSKLTEAEAREILRLAATGMRAFEVHRLFPRVRYHAVRDIYVRRTWRHLADPRAVGAETPGLWDQP